jgi:nucleotide-binding universal stress UspA family protein
MIQRILFPVDFSPSCIAMAAYVRRAAEMFGAEVTIVHVCDLSSHNGFELYVRPGYEIAGEHWSLARSKLKLFLKSEFPAASCPRILLAGDAASMITETAKKNKFDLIVMPTHAGRFRRALLGSTTARVLSHADCPVLTMQHTAIVGPRSLEHRKWVCGIGLSMDSEAVLCYARDAALGVGAKLSVIHVILASELGSKERREFEEVRKARGQIAELQCAIGCHAAVSLELGPIKKALLDAVRQSSADVLVIGRSHHAGALGRMRDLTYSLIRDSPCPVVSV